MMKCPHCKQTRYLRISRSRDRWYLRFLLRQFVRCHYCNFGFLAPLWKNIAPLNPEAADQGNPGEKSAA